MRYKLSILLLLSTIALLSFSPAAQADPARASTQSLDDSLQPLSAKQSRAEEDEDRVDSIAHFSTGRMLQQRQQFKQALREYERALRYDAAAGPVLRELVPLAFAANRNEEGLRYMVKYADQTQVEPEVLEQAAQYVAESGDWKGAIKLDEHVATELSKQKPSAQQVLLQLQLGRLYALDQQYDAAAKQLEGVLEALDHPDKFDLDAKLKKNLLGNGGANYELLGTVFLEAKRPELARRSFEKFNNITPDAATLALNLARVNLVDDKPQQALEELQKYFDAPAVDKDKKAAEGSGAKLSTEQPEKVASDQEKKSATAKETDKETIKEVVKVGGNGIAPYELLSKILKQLMQEDQLLPRLEAMRKSQPDNAMLADFLGKQYLDAGRLDKAQELIEFAHNAQPTIQSYRWLAQIYHKSQQSEKLLKLLGQLLEKSDSLSALGDDAKSIAADDKLTTSLIETARQKFGSADEANFYPLRAAALIAAEAKRWQDAETLFNLAIQAQPKSAADLLLVWGLGLFLDEKYADAAKVFQRGIDDKNSPDDKTSFYFYLASALEMEGKTDEALTAARTAAEKKPTNPSIVARPAWILYHAKRYDDATKAYREVLEKFDDDFATDGARETVREARSALSNLSILKHDIPPAVEYLEQVLDEFPDDPGANNDLGYLWSDENQHLHRAQRMIQFAVDSEPENYAYRDSLGWVLHRLGRDGEALVQLKKAAETDKPEGEVLDHLGEVYSKLGRKGEAQNAWKQSAEAFKKAGEEERMKEVEKKTSASQK